MQAAKEVGVLPISALWAETVQVQKVLAMKPAYVFDNVNSFIEWIRQQDLDVIRQAILNEVEGMAFYPMANRH